MIKNILRIAGTMVLPALLIWGCSGSGTVHEYAVNDLNVTLEGPLFEGPNQGQYSLEIDLKSILGDAYEEGMLISDARLTSATVAPGDSLGFAMVRSLVLSFASDDAEVAMQEVAFKNPLPAESASVALDVAPDAELGTLVSGGTVYLVLDADLAEDFYDGNRSFKINLTLDLTVKS